MANQTDKATIDLVINGKQSEASLKTITTAAVNARKALTQMAETDPGYAKQKRELEALMRAQQQRIVRINEEKTAWQRFTTSAGSMTAGIVGASALSAGLGLIKDGLRAANDEFKAFNAASQELSAVTGATGADLEYLNQQAKRTGPTFGKTGAEMLEAYKLMASAKPELLAQKELLVETTQAAITLSRAGKIDLAEATKVTAESLNQFGEAADQANRFINVIAAGAKEGSAEINDMGVALKNSGTVASAQGVSFEQTNAVLQSMSTIALKGGEAGTMLRNVLLTLGSGADDTNPKMVGLDVALDNLGKKNLSTAQMTKLFGKENVIAAQHIIGHRLEITELTDKVTGTSEAFSQAAKNNETYEQKLAVMDATLSKVAVTVGSKVIPMFTGLLDGVVNVANWFDEQLTPAAESANAAFQDQRAKVADLTKNLTPLLNRHDQLKAKTVLTKNEQLELKNIVAQVANTVPSAVIEFDKYGKALGINTQKAREFIRTQQLLLKVKNEEAIAKSKEALADDEEKLAANKKYRDKATSGAWDVIQASPEELRKLDAANKELGEKIEGRKALLKELEGGNLEIPKAPPTNSGSDPRKPKWGNGDGTPSSSGGDKEESKEEKKARTKREKAQREQERDLKEAERQEERLETMMADARARTAKAEDDVFTADQIKLGEKYQTMYELAGTNKDKMAEITTLMYQELAAIEAQEKERQVKAQEKKADEDLKAKEREYQEAADALALQFQQERELYEPLEAELAKTEEDKKLYALEREEQFLIAQQLLADTYGQTEVDLQKKITDNHVAQSEIRREATVKTTEQMAQATWNLAASYASSMEQGAAALQTFLKKGTAAYKAVIIAQKAAAIAGVVIDTQKEIRQIWANPTASAMPDLGVGLKTAYTVGAGIRAAASIATIAKQGATQIAEKDDGGYTGVMDLYGSAQGFYDRPTKVNAGPRSYMVGEKRKEWIMGGAMLENPVMANLAGALQAMQVTGAYRNLTPGGMAAAGSAGAAPASGGQNDQLLMLLIQETQQSRLAMEKYAGRKINNNYFKVRETADRVDEIRTVTTL